MPSNNPQMSYNIIYTMPYTGGPYYSVPIAGTYPPQNAKLPVNGTSVASMPAAYYYQTAPVQYPVTTQYVAPTYYRQPQIWYHAVSHKRRRPSRNPNIRLTRSHY